MKKKIIHFMVMIIIALFAVSSCGKLSGTKGTDASDITDTAEDDSSENCIIFSQDSGIYAEEFELTISAEGDGDIYYTTDGSNPATGSTAILYSDAILISNRSEDANVVSAVDPLLISTNFNNPDSSRTGFTCDLSAPTDEDVDKCTVIRAVVKESDGTFSQEASAVYFIGTAEEHIQGLAASCETSGTGLMVICISMNYEDLFDSETGIYVKGNLFDEALEAYLATEGSIEDGETARSLNANYKQRGREWEKEASITVFEFSADGTQAVLTQNCGVRIQGNYSRSDLQKGFRLYARTDYGENNFRYAFFGEDYLNDSGEVMDKYKTLILRAGGNCAFTSKFNDAYWQSLVEDMACETQQSRPCVVYLNGEYWGLYVLEEDYSADYFEDLHGVNKEDVVVYKGDAETYSSGYKLDIGEHSEGEDEDYYFRELFDFFDTHENLESEEDYEAFIALVDPDSVMDYFAVECWINNKWDWPGKNWSMWKTVTTDSTNEYADGRWRFLFYDMEFGGVSGSSDAGVNTIKEDNYKTYGLLDMNTGNPAVLCFAYLMTNDDFCDRFCIRLSELSQTNFEQTAALEQLQVFENMYSPLYDQFFARYPGTGSTEYAVSGGYASIQCIRDFLMERENYIENMIIYCREVLGG